MAKKTADAVDYKEIEKAVVKARVALLLDHPFFGSLAMKLDMICDDKVPTACTNGKWVRYNPNWFGKLGTDFEAQCNAIKAVLAHEILHCVYNHIHRRNSRNPEKWNMAGDYVINLIVEECGMKLPKGVLLDNKYKGMCSEEVYNRLDENGNGGGDGAEDGDGDGNGEWNIGGFEDAPADADKQGCSEEDWRIAAAQAAKIAKAAGKLPGGLAELVEDLFEPQIDWRTVLHDAVDRVTRNDYSWVKPNKRYTSVILPTLHSMELGKVVIGIDTSGSISSEDLSLFKAEINGILEAFESVDVTVIYCDTEVGKVDNFTEAPIEMEVVGRGGTAFAPVFKYIEQEQLDPKLLIYMTDGDNYDTEEVIAPEYPVLFLGNQKFTPPFGDFALLNKEYK